MTDPRVNGRWFLNGGYYDRQPAGAPQPTLLVGRPLLEGVIRARVLQLPNVRVIERCDALGLVADQHRGRITGVHVLRRRAGSAEEVVAADLVVDASGRASRASAWLQALGYDPPVEERIGIDLTYTSRQFRRLPTDLDGDHFAMVFPDPDTRRAGLAAAQQDDRWLVTLAGYLGERAPTDDAGYRDYARSLRAADVWDVVRTAEPLDTATTMRFPASVRRRYERLRRFPDGFVVTGDALCSFNPVYAQGITVAALEAEILSACLSRGVNQLGRRFFRHAGAVVDSAWRVSAGGDLRFTAGRGQANQHDPSRQLVPRSTPPRRPSRRHRRQRLPTGRQHAGHADQPPGARHHPPRRPPPRPTPTREVPERPRIDTQIAVKHPG